MTQRCFFHGCANVRAANSPKCDAHKHRSKCTVADCFNQVYARNLCVRHGGKKQCAFDRCEGNARAGPFCCKHNTGETKKRFCTAPGCSHVARAKGLCVSHGGGRKCEAEGCASYARDRGFCRRHRIPAVRIQARRTEPVVKVEQLVEERPHDMLELDILAAVFDDDVVLGIEPIDFDATASLDAIESSVLDALLDDTIVVSC
ncbi:Aste57867_12880 [Aphanomyces stellatus]|uniref:Aste57867_12880 protein n=1 Tax=Aphanomyces stellatus TaxID=120398 RepID=A0A485KYC2_9STRA|nr:hypothetical protein As57867_012832 [Aphanomyces stellatus]VFT89727.1 Aste57867_12880 [Aphanomyces stellatus]